MDKLLRRYRYVESVKRPSVTVGDLFTIAFSREANPYAVRPSRENAGETPSGRRPYPYWRRADSLTQPSPCLSQPSYRPAVSARSTIDPEGHIPAPPRHVF